MIKQNQTFIDFKLIWKHCCWNEPQITFTTTGYHEVFSIYHFPSANPFRIETDLYDLIFYEMSQTCLVELVWSASEFRVGYSVIRRLSSWTNWGFICWLQETVMMRKSHENLICINSLGSGRCGSNFKSVILEHFPASIATLAQRRHWSASSRSAADVALTLVFRRLRCYGMLAFCRSATVGVS